MNVTVKVMPAPPVIGIERCRPLCEQQARERQQQSRPLYGRTSGYVYVGHGSEPHLQLSAVSGVVDPKSIFDPSANVISRALKARAFGSFAGHPEMVSLVPTFSLSL